MNSGYRCSCCDKEKTDKNKAFMPWTVEKDVMDEVDVAICFECVDRIIISGSDCVSEFLKQKELESV